MNDFEKRRMELYESVSEIVDSGAMFKAKRDGEEFKVDFPEKLERDFYSLVDRVSLALMEDKDNFYGYFLLQMAREIRFDISSATGVNFKSAKYVIYFNPLIFLQLNMNQMEAAIKHEIHHILSLHLLRSKDMKGKYSTLAMNLAMDIVVNEYLDYLPPNATTIEWVNLDYNLDLEHYNTFEYYAEKIQSELDLREESKKGEEDDTRRDENLKDKFDPGTTHDIWDESDDIDERTIEEFTEKYISNSSKGRIPLHVEAMVKALKNSRGELPWNLYLKKLMGTVESNKKKTITRRSRRQPDRMDLRGELRNHKAEIAVAIDISGSISDAEFKQAIKEVLDIVKNYNHEISIIECDREIKRVYKVKNPRDVQDRHSTGGGTSFEPVIQFANDKSINLLIYFTDGKGEKKLQVKPRGYKVLWVISGAGEGLSLQESYGVVKKLKKVEVKDEAVDMHDVRHDGWSMNSQEPTLDI